jgi:hypothetical protein
VFFPDTVRALDTLAAFPASESLSLLDAVTSCVIQLRRETFVTTIK